MKPRQRRSALFIAVLLVFGLASVWGAAWAQAATGGSKLVVYGRVQFRVPVKWPVIDLASSPTACIRFDVSAVYLGRQDRQSDCPALLVGRTNAMYVEPLDAQSVEQARFPKASTAINGQTAYRGIGTETGGSLVAAFPRLGVLATVSFGTDKAQSERVLASFDHVRGTPLLSRTSLPKAPRTPSQPAAPPTSHRNAPMGTGSIYTGEGFDTCAAPTTSSMSAWLASPMRSIGVYIGGINRGCAQPNLTSSWVVTVEGQGWNLVPIYVGLQAPCSGFANRIITSQAASEGVAAADDAATQAALIGLASGDPIYFDMESYDDSNTSCVQGVEDFISAWVGELHVKGFVAGMYGGAASGMRDEAAIYNNPNYNTLDDIWNAHWDGKHQVFGDPYFPDTVWPNHQRLHQYQGGHNETWGGVTINIDNDYDDGAVACSYVSAGLIPPSPTAGIPPGAVGTPGPRFDLFDLGPNGTVEHTTWTCPPGWSNTENIGGTLSSGPAATSMTPGTDQEAFAEGTDLTLQENVQDASGTWGGWTSVGGVLSARPAAVSWGPGRIDVFVRGTDAKVWHKWYSSGAWSGWQSLGGVLPTGVGPAAASWGVNQLEVFAQGTNQAIWEKTWNGSIWSAWSSLGGVVVGDPGAASPAAGQVQVFARGTDDHLWYRLYASGAWTAWRSLGGTLTSGPAPAVATAGAAPNVTAVFALGSDGGIWERRNQGIWGPWVEVP
jgi:hypothetical protein